MKSLVHAHDARFIVYVPVLYMEVCCDYDMCEMGAWVNNVHNQLYMVCLSVCLLQPIDSVHGNQKGSLW